jgi:hypothetical protein
MMFLLRTSYKDDKKHDILYCPRTWLNTMLMMATREGALRSALDKSIAKA